MKFSLIVIAFLWTQTLYAQQVSYSWSPARTGGGGYITGIIQSQDDPLILYARCDVGGVFKSTDGGKNWATCNATLSKWYNHSVQSICLSPGNHNIVFRCSGDMRNKTLFGSIHRSVDGGATWREVCSKVGYYGNGGTRMFGELIAVDPFDTKYVITAGYSGGIWVSSDSGSAWNYAAANGERFATVGINPYFRNMYFAGTTSGKLFFSNDKGQTWRMVYHAETENQGFTEFAFDKKNRNMMYASCRNGIYRSENAGKSFNPVMNGLPASSYNTVVTDPSDTRILYTAPDARPGHQLAPVPVYRSVNSGKSWELIKKHTPHELNDYPSYIRSPEFVGWAISKVRVDVSSSSKIMFSNWYGVSFSTDRGMSWSGHQFSGLETNCLEHIAFLPNPSNESFYTVADHMPMKSTDSGKTYHMLPRSAMSSSTALVKSVHDTSFIIFGARRKTSAAIFRVNGDTCTTLKQFDRGYVQALREDPFTAGCFYALVDGELNEVGGLYKTIDWGSSWTKLPAPEKNLTSFPQNAMFIENELLNIVVGQRKNVCGANQLLCINPLKKNVLYLGEWTEGIYRSGDGGNTWKNISKGLPFHADTASVLTVIKVHPGNGWLYAGFIREGLWCSKDEGITWTKVFPKENKILNVNSVHAGGITGNEIFIAGENLYWSDSAVQIMYSADNGETWQNIYDNRLGALRIKSLDVNRTTGDIILATSGNGAFYATRNK